MNMKHLTAALGILTAGVISAIEISTFYPMGKMGIFFPEETPEFQIKLKDPAPTVSGIYTTYHLEIPWTEIRIGKPVKGKAFGMCPVFFDLNRSGVMKADLCVALTEGLTGGQDPSKFKTFILE